MTAGWGGRIKAVLKDQSDFKYDDAMKKLGRGKSSVFEYEKELRQPDITFLRKLMEHTGVSIDWLADGAGPKMRGLDRQALQTAVKAALRLVESSRLNGKVHDTNHVVDIICAMYDEITVSSLAESETDTNSERIHPQQETMNAVTPHRKSNP